ncbi:MAG: hypothetical protein HY875_08495 [Chloroflexi bacterium]|nr:hypothetical protein [Chloroflexota bacterium]
MRALRFVGLVGAWAVAGLLWLVVAFAVFCIAWFTWFGPGETEHVAAFWTIIGAVAGFPALLITARLGGFWHRLFPEG